MTEADTRAVLVELFRNELGDPGLKPQPDDLEYSIPGFDSGKKVLLILAVEERFAVRLRSRESDALRGGAWADDTDRHAIEARLLDQLFGGELGAAVDSLDRAFVHSGLPGSAPLQWRS